MTRTITMSGAALPTAPTGEPALILRSIQGEELLSNIYSYAIDCRTPDESVIPEHAAANLDLKSMIGKELTVSIELEGMGSFVTGLSGAAGATNIGSGIREISGIVTQAHFVGQSDQQSFYQLVLKPWVSLLEQRTDFRIFQRKTVVEIIEQVFENYMYSYDVRLSERYPTLDYQVQYGESDFDFIQRLMAEHGIYWFFEHSGTFHRMILVDHLGAHKPVKSVAYQTLWYFPPGHRTDVEHIEYLDLNGSLQSGRWTTNDFDFKKPGAKLIKQNELPQETAHNDLERYEWPGDFTDPSHGERFARLRMEEVRAQGERASGSGNVRNIVCGTTFKLEGYPHEAANREYIVIASSINASEADQTSGSGKYSFTSSFVVQPATTVFRPPREGYSKPRTSGPQTAIVTGPPGQEIWTDQYGRIKLKFHWDRSEINNQNSSCWVRVSYPWAGGGYGGVNIPRIGNEVIVDFENGDPDRPIVVGRLYNAGTMPPWPLPANATQSGMLSRSMKGNVETANGIRFEDRHGAEEVWLQAQKDMNTTVKNNESHSVAADRNRSVGGNETVHIAKDRAKTIDSNETISVGGNRVASINKDETITVAGSHDENIGGAQSVAVALASAETVGLAKALTVGGAYAVSVGGAINTAAGLASAEEVGLHKSTMVGTSYSITAGDRFELTVGAAKLVLESSGNISITGADIKINGTTVKVDATTIDLN
nr:type VI secretion system tip protein TssI/VgrG [Caballeronia sp. NK8]